MGSATRIQLNYQASWNVLSNSGEPTQSGFSDSQLAVKWRYYDAGDTGLQLSMYPRYTFVNPGSDSDRRGTADPNATFLLPFEARRDFGFVAGERRRRLYLQRRRGRAGLDGRTLPRAARSSRDGNSMRRST